MANNYTLARSEDGTVQITYSIAFSDIETAKQKAIVELAKNVEVPGFRKGMAPAEKAAEKIPDQAVVEKALNSMLPKLFGETIEVEKLKPVAYPRFELVSAKDNEPWQVVATTAELVDFDLGDYKALIKGSATKVWKPGDDKKEEKMTSEQKESAVISALVKNIKVKIPKILLDEEVNARLSKLLEQIDKLGLTIDSYLASIGKKIDDVRLEYEQQAQEILSLDFILVKISQLENITVTPEEVAEAIKISSNSDPSLQKDLENPERKRLIQSILLKRNTLNRLISYL